jgi:hypothetical protein
MPPGRRGTARATNGRRGPQPLAEPLPRIDSILIAHDRRLAIVDGAIVGVGDVVGQRTLAQIDPMAVIFREPSGIEVRVPLRGGGARDDK